MRVPVDPLIPEADDPASMNPRNQAGITLFEVIVCVVLVLVLWSLAIPSVTAGPSKDRADKPHRFLRPDVPVTRRPSLQSGKSYRSEIISLRDFRKRARSLVISMTSEADIGIYIVPSMWP